MKVDCLTECVDSGRCFSAGKRVMSSPVIFCKTEEMRYEIVFAYPSAAGRVHPK